MPDSPPSTTATALNPLQSAVHEAASNEPLREVMFAGRLGILAIALCALASTGSIALEGWSSWKELDGDLIRRGLHTLSIIRIILYAISAGWFLKWTHLCAANANRIAPHNPDIHPATAVGSYFIPILNLFGPYQQMQEIVEVTEKKLSRNDISPLVRPWWLAWWGMNAIWLLGSEIRTPAVMIGEWLLVLVATSGAIRLISRLSGAQSLIQPPFEVVHLAPKPKPKREQVRRPSKPGHAAARPSTPLPQRKPGAIPPGRDS